MNQRIVFEGTPYQIEMLRALMEYSDNDLPKEVENLENNDIQSYYEFRDGTIIHHPNEEEAKKRAIAYCIESGYASSVDAYNDEFFEFIENV